ncbi:MAG TPA: condensation domain-containing protein, partial [Longimicrobiaceae bacterium]|nr:condensation domain-containing protein [Longimicrobiaceae bacterium]
MQNIADVYRVTPRQQDMLAALAKGAAGTLVGQTAWTARRMADPEAFARAWRLVVARHPVLRTGLFTEGMAEPLQVVRAEAPLHWEERDLPGSADGGLDALEAEERARGFDPAAAPLMRVVQVRLGEGEYRFVWTWSALVLDARSASLLLEEVAEAYRALRRGEEPPAARAHPYRGYVAWLERQDAAAARAFWADALRGVEVPAAAPAASSAGAGTRVRQAFLGMAETERLAAAMQQQKLSWGAAAAGCWALALHARTGAAAPLFGVGVEGRPGGLAGSDAMPGSFRSTLPLRATVDAGADAAGWMRSVQRSQEALRPFEHVSHAQVRAWAGLQDGAPLFEGALEVAAPESDALVRLLGGLAFQDVVREDPSEGHALEVRVTVGQEVAVRARFDPARVDAAGVDALLEGFLAALDAFGAGPERRVADLLGAAGDRASARVEVGASHPEAAEVEAILARHPGVESVGVESTGGGLRARIVPRADAVARDRARKRLSFSLFYFADAGDGEGEDRYRIYLE